jgi:hypothetical protein
MVQIIEQPETLLGTLGRGLGQGAQNLASQIPKEYERQRLSQGLKQFEQNSQGLTPLQAYSQIASIPGITPQMIQALPEILKYQGQREAAINQGQLPPSGLQASAQVGQEPPRGQQQDQPRPQGGRPISPVDEANRLASLTTKAPVQTGLSLIRPLTQQEFLGRRAQVLDQNPWMSVDAADNFVRQEDERRIDQERAYLELGEREKGIESDYVSRFEADKEKKLQKTNKETYSDVSGETEKKIRNRGEDKIAFERYTPKEAAEWASDQVLNVGKARKNLEKLSKQHIVEEKPSTVRKKLDSIRKTYKDADALEEYKDLLISEFKASRGFANSIAYPVNENKRINEYINAIPKSVTELGKFGAPDLNKAAKNSLKYAHDIETMLDDNTSLQSVAQALKKKYGYFDEGIFYDYFRSHPNIRLNDRQERELQEAGRKTTPQWGDVFLDVFGSLF